MKQLVKELFEAVQDILEQEKRNTKVEIELETGQPGEEILHAFFSGIGDYDGAFMTEVNLITAYKDKAVGAVQFYSTLSAQIREELFPSVEDRLNELNALCIFGAFGLYKEGAQIFHRYVMPVALDNLTDARIQFVWKEIFSSLMYLLPYILIISNEKDFMGIDEYMEAMGEAD